jgi:hypothetical protein
MRITCPTEYPCTMVPRRCTHIPLLTDSSCHQWTAQLKLNWQSVWRCVLHVAGVVVSPFCSLNAWHIAALMSEATFIRDTAGFGEGEHSELRACGSRPPPWNTGPASEVVLGGNTPLDWMQPVPAGVVLHPSPFHRVETQRQVWQLHTQHTHVCSASA